MESILLYGLEPNFENLYPGGYYGEKEYNHPFYKKFSNMKRYKYQYYSPKCIYCFYRGDPKNKKEKDRFIKKVKYLIKNNKYPNNGVSKNYGFISTYYKRVENCECEDKYSMCCTNCKYHGNILIDREPEIVDILLKNGTDPNKKDEYGETAIFDSNLSSTKKLIKYGANCNITSENEDTPLHNLTSKESIRACAPKWMKNKISILVKNGCDINKRNKNGYAPLHIAKKIVEVRALIKCGANVNIRDNLGRTPLHLAETRIVHVLLKNYADINILDNNGKNAIHYNKNLKAMQLLFEKNLDLDLKDNDGKTPIQYQNYKDTIKFLIKKGCKLEHINSEKDVMIGMEPKYSYKMSKYKIRRREIFNFINKYKVKYQKVTSKVKYLKKLINEQIVYSPPISKLYRGGIAYLEAYDRFNIKKML